jgi:hypothetical protein
MPKRLRSDSPPMEGENHPIVWFSALLRGVDRNDKALVEEAEQRLERLGYFVVPFPPKDCDRKGVTP